MDIAVSCQFQVACAVLQCRVAVHEDEFYFLAFEATRGSPSGEICDLGRSSEGDTKDVELIDCELRDVIGIGKPIISNNSGCIDCSIAVRSARSQGDA